MGMTGFAEAVAARVDSEVTAEDELGEVPEEFLDPIMSELMTDPVLLTTSNHICDRRTIERHMLSDKKDPFNRSPITVDDLVPAVELQARISAWVAERKHGATTRPTSSDDTPSKKLTLSVTPVNVQGAPLMLSITSADDIASVARRVEERLGVPEGSIELRLPQTDTGLPSDTVDLPGTLEAWSTQQSERVPMTIKAPKGEQYAVELELSADVSELKTIIATHSGVPPSQQRLFYKGKVLK